MVSYSAILVRSLLLSCKRIIPGVLLTSYYFSSKYRIKFKKLLSDTWLKNKTLSNKHLNIFAEKEKDNSMLLIDPKEICSSQIWIDTYTSSKKIIATTLILIKIINCIPRRKA